MNPVTDPGLISQLEGSNLKPISDPALLSQLEGQPEEGSFLSRWVKNRADAAVRFQDPQTWKDAFHELTNWPKFSTENAKPLQQMAVDSALSFNPITPMSGAFRASLNPNPIVDSAKQAVLRNAQGSGYVVPPSDVNPSKLSILESTSGKAATRQKASAINAPVTQELIKKDLGIPVSSELTTDSIRAVRQQAGNVYETAKSLGTFTVDEALKKDIANITKETSPLGQEIPELVNKDIKPIADAIIKNKTLSAETTVDAISELRARANDAYRAGNNSYGRSLKKIADALEGLIERHIDPKTMPEFLDQFRNARQLIAKTYTAEKAINSASSPSQVLGRELMKGAPLSGGMRQAAEFANEFPKAVLKPEAVGSPNVSKVGAMASALLGWGGGVAGGAPGAVGLGILPQVAPAAARSIMFSGPYQASLLSDAALKSTKNPMLARLLLLGHENNPNE